MTTIAEPAKAQAVKKTRKPIDPVNAIIYVIMLFVSVICIFPILHTISISLSSPGPANAGLVTFYPQGLNFENYVKITQDKRFLHAFGISVQRVIAVVVLSFFVSIMLAFPLSRSDKKFPLRPIYMWLLIFVMMFNSGIIPFYMIMRQLHLTNTFLGLVLPMIVNIFNVILVMNYFRSIPKEMDESAAMDGAGPWRMLFQIYIPLSIPVLATVTLFSIVFTWNEYFLGLIMVQDQNLIPLQTYIQGIVVQIDPTRIATDPSAIQVSNKTLNAAKIFVTMIPIMIIYPFLQRYFINGIMLGSVKE
ncbi:carbohydrate ABC transporter permease [Paenibacillus sp. GCM10023252]|uniref:carbohydrate ABC transporter permease n=1 Tax=Paenibacillus sp. GCM10023252 TaxID=3252649 RepID=UPI00361C3084